MLIGKALHGFSITILLLVIGISTVESAGTLPCSCGKGKYGGKPNKPKPKIVGGKLALNHAYPWIGALVYTGGSNPSQFCGATLINDRHLLTAGHCVFGRAGSISNYQVFLGTNSINGSDIRRSDISSITVHPQYNADTLENDIALIQLSQPIEFSQEIRPVCLASGNQLFTGRRATAAGWGAQAKQGPPVNGLRQVTVKVLENGPCARSYAGQKVRVTQNMLCASLPGKDSCSGDSGGPLVIRGRRGTFQQIGIVSFGIDCGKLQHPGVYTRVTKYHRWIRDNTKDGQYCSR